MRVEHTLKPIYDKDSITLILGSMPSIASRNQMKYYGHKNNRFWTVLELIYNEKIDDWKDFILKNRLALWDVIESCDIIGSSDSSIKNVKTNDINELISKTQIRNIVLLGKSAYDLYNKYIFPTTNIEGIYLPSPSSANAQYKLEDLLNAYKIIKEITK